MRKRWNQVLQRRLVGEVCAHIACKVWNSHCLRLCGADGDKRHGQRITIGECRASDIAKPLREIGVVDAVAAKHAVHTDTVVQVVARLCARDEVRVGVGVHASNLQDARAREALPVEADLVEKVRELGSHERDKLSSIRRDEDALHTALICEGHNGSGQQILERVVAVWEPACRKMSSVSINTRMSRAWLSDTFDRYLTYACDHRSTVS
jgi:hypothetical protein